MTEVRRERDTMGWVEVPAGRYWGAQTQRALEHFAIGRERMPRDIIRALGLIKQAAARVNRDLGVLEPGLADAITEAATEVAAGALDDHFPLVVWQTGSGTQSNMNANEVIANRASEILGGGLGEARLVHPNDHVNRSQSSNDVFPTAMSLAALAVLDDQLVPALDRLAGALAGHAAAWADVIKIGRTHMMDATPLSLGQEVSGWQAQVEHARRQLDRARPSVAELAIGGTAVGTGLGAPAEFGERMVVELARLARRALTAAPNRFAALAAHDGLVALSGALKVTACALMKIAGDVRILSSGPRCGLGELVLPANEPGSSIMPGKVNPTQCEALLMVGARVLGNDMTIAVAGASATLQLNVMKPVMADAVLQSLRLLADGADSFRRHAIDGLAPDRGRIAELVGRSLMLVTALSPSLGYDRAAAIAKDAHARGVTLREAAVASGAVSGEDFDRLVRPETMIGPH